MEKKQKVKSDEIDLIGIVERIWDERRFLIRFTLLIFVIGVIIAFSLPRVYKSESKIIPEDTKDIVANKANSFATLLGLGVNSTGTEISADIYPDIIKSTPYLLEFANLEVQPQGMEKMSLYEYMMLHQKEAWWSFVVQLPRKIGGLFGPKAILENDTIWNISRLSKQQRQFIRNLANSIYVNADKETGVITIDVLMQDPEVATFVAENIIQQLYTYITSYRTQKAREELKFIEDMYVEAHNAYDQTQERFKGYSKDYKTDSSPVTSQVNMDLTFGFYNMMAQQYEMAKVNVMKKRPIFSVIEPAMMPLNADSPRKMLIMLLSIGLGIFVGIIWIFIKDAFVK